MYLRYLLIDLEWTHAIRIIWKRLSLNQNYARVLKVVPHFYKVGGNTKDRL